MFSHLYRREVEEGCLNISFGHVHHCLYQCHATPHHMISARVEEHFVERKIFCSCRICFDINSSILCFRTSIEFLYNRYLRFPRWWYSHFTIDICVWKARKSCKANKIKKAGQASKSDKAGKPGKGSKACRAGLANCAINPGKAH